MDFSKTAFDSPQRFAMRENAGLVYIHNDWFLFFFFTGVKQRFTIIVMITV